MKTIASMTHKIRSKNAGPFWITLDIFCGDTNTLNQIAQALPTDRASAIAGVEPERVRRFEIQDLSVLKLSFPRPEPQGSRYDRDMHGAQLATLFAELEVL